MNSGLYRRLSGIWIAFALYATLAAGQTNTFPSSGNVGIGTTSPGSTLDVYGKLQMSMPNQGFSAMTLGDNLATPGNNGWLLRANNHNSPFNGVSDSLGFEFWNGTNEFLGPTFLPSGSVGIGTTQPTAALHIANTTNLATSDGFAIKIKASDATALLEGAVAGYSVINSMQDYVSWTNRPLALQTLGGNVGIGTTNPQYPLSVNGTIQAKEVLVNTGWSDYVFAPEYRVKPLTEVAAFIKANHHLPDIPSEAEVFVVPDKQYSGNFFANAGPTRNYGLGSPANGSTLSSYPTGPDIYNGPYAGADEDMRPNDCSLWNDKGKAVLTNMQSYNVTFTGSHQAVITLSGLGQDPLEFQAPTVGIKWNVSITLDTTDPNNPTAQVTRSHTCYPAHIVKVNGVTLLDDQPQFNNTAYLTACLADPTWAQNPTTTSVITVPNH